MTRIFDGLFWVATAAIGVLFPLAIQPETMLGFLAIAVMARPFLDSKRNRRYQLAAVKIFVLQVCGLFLVYRFWENGFTIRHGQELWYLWGIAALAGWAPFHLWRYDGQTGRMVWMLDQWVSWSLLVLIWYRAPQAMQPLAVMVGMTWLGVSLFGRFLDIKNLGFLALALGMMIPIVWVAAILFGIYQWQAFDRASQVSDEDALTLLLDSTVIKWLHTLPGSFWRLGDIIIADGAYELIRLGWKWLRSQRPHE